MALRFVLDGVDGAIEAAFKALETPMARAAKAAITEAGAVVKREARSDIAAAGFGKKAQNALRVDLYPEGGRASIDAAANVYHKFFYFGVFDEGTTINAKKLMWLPLRGTPKRFAGQRMTVELMADRSPHDLVFFTSKAGQPLLAVQVRVPRKSRRTKLSMAAVARGKRGEGVIRNIPVFVGVERVTMPDKLEFREILQRAQDRLAELYARALEAEA